MQIFSFIRSNMIWNVVDLTVSCMCITVPIVHQCGIHNTADQNTIVICATILSAAFFIKWLNYLRAFKSTGFYVRMILNIFNDSSVFLGIMLLLIVSFATGFYLCFCTVPIYDRDMETAVIDDDGVTAPRKCASSSKRCIISSITFTMVIR